MITWNACGASRETLNLIVESFSRECSWSCLLFQEVYRFDVSVGTVGPHVLCAGTGPWRTSVVVVNANLHSCVTRWDISSATPIVYLDIKDQSLQVCSAHLPTVGHSTEVFQNEINELHTKLGSFTGSRVAGIDANVELGWLEISDLVGPYTTKAIVGEEHAERSHIFGSFIEALHMRATNSIPAAEDYFIHRHYVTKVRSQRDFILYNGPCEDTREVWIDYESYHKTTESDHVPVGARIAIVIAPPKRRRRKPVGWKYRAEVDAQAFNRHVHHHFSAMELSTNADQLGAFTRVVAEAASQHGSVPRGIWESSAHKTETSQLEQRRRLCHDPQLRREISNNISHLRRKQNRRLATERARDAAMSGRANAWRRQQAPRHVTTQLEGSVNKAEWSQKLHRFFHDIFTDSSPETKAWEAANHDILQQTCDDIDISVEEVRVAISQLKRNRTTSSDMLSAEMIATLSDENIHILTDLLTSRIRNETPRPDSWSTLMAILLPKVQAASQCKDFRPITLIPVLMKLSCRILLNKTCDVLTQGQSDNGFGCRKGYTAMDMVQTIRQVVEKSTEWSHPVVILKLEFKKACDSVKSRHRTCTGEPGQQIAASSLPQGDRRPEHSVCS